MEEIDPLLADPTTPMRLQHTLAYTVVELVHGGETAEATAKLAAHLYQQAELPEDALLNAAQHCLQVKPGSEWKLLSLLHTLWPEQSKNQLRHACLSGAVTLNGRAQLTDPTAELPPGNLIIGLGRQFKLVVESEAELLRAHSR